MVVTALIKGRTSQRRCRDLLFHQVSRGSGRYRARDTKANAVTHPGDPWGLPSHREHDPYEQWFANPTEPLGYPPPVAPPSRAVPVALPGRPSLRRRLTALLAGAAALAVALGGGAVIVGQHKVPFAAGPLTGVSVADSSGSAAKPATPKKHVAPAPVYSVGQVARLVTPGVVIINSTLGDQNAIAAGTGMILTADGEILTNNHVIDGATSITVTVVNTGRRYVADLVGTSVANDVALLKLRDASGLSVVPIATSDAINTGTSVVAIGNAGGTGTLSVVSGTVTSINQSITASDASGTSSERLSGMIEVKALIRAGDSGGPLANRAGKVIGMDTAASSTRNNNATAPTYGFAIPINRALAIAQGIRSAGPSGTAANTRGYLGIEVQGTDPQNNLGGAVIVGVTPASPAARAGLQAGDTITDVDGRTVTSGNSLTQTLQGTKPGQGVRVGWVDSSGESHYATITLASGPAD
jgi:S1-C subfamily serine protease